MGDEVTKKDLQSLQGYVNKQIAELKDKIDDAKSAGRKDGDELDKIIVRVRSDLDKEIEELNRKVADLQDGINTLAKAVADASKKSGGGLFS